MDPVMIILRTLHIGGGVLWVGAAWTLFLFVGPTLRALGGETEKSFMAYVTRQRRLTQVILLATVATVGAGAALYWIQWQNFGELWFQTGFGIAITIGSIAALIAFVLGPTIISPSLGRMGKLGAQLDAEGRPPTPDEAAEMARLGSRLKTFFAYNFGLLVVAVFFMATARYW